MQFMCSFFGINRILIMSNHRRRSRGRGAVAPTCRQGGTRYQMPPFRRLSGMMPASTEKTGIYTGGNV